MGKRDKRKQRQRREATRPRARIGGPAPARLDPPAVRLEEAGPYTWVVRQTEGMNVPGLIFGDHRIIEAVRREEGAQQVANVATLPGIVGRSIAMPDIHWGYGFPIGGVAAFDAEQGVVSPGGIGYDINCGVRLVATDLSAASLGSRLPEVVAALQRAIPAGLGSRQRGQALEPARLDRVLSEGAHAALAMGFGEPGDLSRIEDQGRLDGADPAQVSPKARERGRDQLGTLGSGNHFVEVQRVDEVFDEVVARVFGLFEGQLVVMIHTGSRGLGHQVCTDAVLTMGRAARDAGIALPDRQLACAPLGTSSARDYLDAMAAAANFAFANRHVIDHLARRALEQALGIGPAGLGFRLVYDVAHNIAKLETHEVEGRRRRVLVHRKGATRALGPGSPDLPDDLRPVGQPVLVPGDMGRASWVLAGAEGAAASSFASACHGAGRRLSRSAALRSGRGRSIADELAARGIIARAESHRTLLEEMPEAYKDVDHVVEVVIGAGLCRPIARCVPLGVVKG
jgi:tRNA-splicing ligase RtcB